MAHKNASLQMSAKILEIEHYHECLAASRPRHIAISGVIEVQQEDGATYYLEECN